MGIELVLDRGTWREEGYSTGYMSVSSNLRLYIE